MDWTTLIAGYAAGVATIVGIRQVLADLPRVLVNYSDVTLTGGGRPNRPAHNLTIVNAGRRPVTITQVGYQPKADFHALPADWIVRGDIPFTLGEGQYKNLILVKEEQQDPLPGDALWYALDSLGRLWPRSRRSRIRFRVLIEKAKARVARRDG